MCRFVLHGIAAAFVAYVVFLALTGGAKSVVRWFDGPAETETSEDPVQLRASCQDHDPELLIAIEACRNDSDLCATYEVSGEDHTCTRKPKCEGRDCPCFTFSCDPSDGECVPTTVERPNKRACTVVAWPTVQRWKDVDCAIIDACEGVRHILLGSYCHNDTCRFTYVGPPDRCPTSVLFNDTAVAIAGDSDDPCCITDVAVVTEDYDEISRARERIETMHSSHKVHFSGIVQGSVDPYYYKQHFSVMKACEAAPNGACREGACFYATK